MAGQSAESERVCEREDPTETCLTLGVSKDRACGPCRTAGWPQRAATLASLLTHHRVMSRNRLGKTGCRGCTWTGSATPGTDTAWAEWVDHVLDLHYRPGPHVCACGCTWTAPVAECPECGSLREAWKCSNCGVIVPFADEACECGQRPNSGDDRG